MSHSDRLVVLMRCLRSILLHFQAVAHVRLVAAACFRLGCSCGREAVTRRLFDCAGMLLGMRLLLLLVNLEQGCLKLMLV